MTDDPDKRDTQELEAKISVRELAELRYQAGRVPALEQRISELEAQGKEVLRTVLGGEAVEIVVRVVR